MGCCLRECGFKGLGSGITISSIALNVAYLAYHGWRWHAVRGMRTLADRCAKELLAHEPDVALLNELSQETSCEDSCEDQVEQEAGSRKTITRRLRRKRLGSEMRELVGVNVPRAVVTLAIECAHRAALDLPSTHLRTPDNERLVEACCAKHIRSFTGVPSAAKARACSLSPVFFWLARVDNVLPAVIRDSAAMRAADSVGEALSGVSTWT